MSLTNAPEMTQTDNYLQDSSLTTWNRAR